MSDQRIRELERLSRESGDPEIALRYRMARIRAGLETMPTTSYQVLELHLKSLEKKVKSYAKRAQKQGLIPLALHVGTKTWVERSTPDGRTARLPVYSVTMIGDAPTTDDWTFIAALHHTPSGTVIQRAWGVTEANFPEADLVKFRDRDSACEHCNLRRKRNDTYVLQHKTNGTVIQVGRTCLGDFLSCSPEAALYQFKTERKLTEILQKSNDLDDKARPEWGVSFVSFLSHLCATKRNLSRSRYQALNSWHNAMRYGISDSEGKLARGLGSEDIEQARKVLAAAREHLKPAQEGLSQRDHNLAVIVAEDTVSNRHAGLASTVLGWYDRFQRAQKAKIYLDPSERARDIVAAVSQFSNLAPLAASGTTVTLGADDFARLLLANGELDSVRAKLREIMGEGEPEADSQHLGEEGEQGTWNLTVTRLRDCTPCSNS